MSFSLIRRLLHQTCSQVSSSIISSQAEIGRRSYAIPTTGLIEFLDLTPRDAATGAHFNSAMMSKSQPGYWRYLRPLESNWLFLFLLFMSKLVGCCQAGLLARLLSASLRLCCFPQIGSNQNSVALIRLLDIRMLLCCLRLSGSLSGADLYSSECHRPCINRIENLQHHVVWDFCHFSPCQTPSHTCCLSRPPWVWDSFILSHGFGKVFCIECSKGVFSVLCKYVLLQPLRPFSKRSVGYSIDNVTFESSKQKSRTCEAIRPPLRDIWRWISHSSHENAPSSTGQNTEATPI